uniref:Uncharacterized protein n=1 Tax=Anguilla anguilla TaxID=7936 RepID=A0A0E9TBX2_ANGAN
MLGEMKQSEEVEGKQPSGCRGFVFTSFFFNLFFFFFH